MKTYKVEARKEAGEDWCEQGAFTSIAEARNLLAQIRDKLRPPNVRIIEITHRTVGPRHTAYMRFKSGLDARHETSVAVVYACCLIDNEIEFVAFPLCYLRIRNGLLYAQLDEELECPVLFHANQARERRRQEQALARQPHS